MVPDGFLPMSLDDIAPGDVVYITPGAGAEPMGPMIVELVDGALLAVSDVATIVLAADGVEIYGRQAVVPLIETRDIYDDLTRTVKTVNAISGEVLATRPYNTSENENADQAAAEVAATLAAATIEVALNQALAALQAIMDDTSANINASPASRIKDLARVMRRIIRLQIRRFDGTS